MSSTANVWYSIIGMATVPLLFVGAYAGWKSSGGTFFSGIRTTVSKSWLIAALVYLAIPIISVFILVRTARWLRLDDASPAWGMLAMFIVLFLWTGIRGKSGRNWLGFRESASLKAESGTSTQIKPASVLAGLLPPQLASIVDVWPILISIVAAEFVGATAFLSFHFQVLPFEAVTKLVNDVFPLGSSTVHHSEFTIAWLGAALFTPIGLSIGWLWHRAAVQEKAKGRSWAVLACCLFTGLMFCSAIIQLAGRR